MARFPAPAKMSKLPPATPSSRCHGRVKPLAWVANAAPMKVVPSAGSRERERRRVELPGELERLGRLGESACGEDDSDQTDVDEGKDRGESRTGGDGEARPVGPRSPAPPDEPVETGHEDEQQRQFHRLQADSDRDCVAILREGEHLLDRSAEGRPSRSRQHRVLYRHRHRERDRRGADDSRRGHPVPRGHCWCRCLAHSSSSDR